MDFPDGAQIESCCVLTTQSNELIKPIHNRMPVVVPNGYEKKWTEQIKDSYELKGLASIMLSWSPEGWVSEKVNKRKIEQINLF